MVEGIVSGNNLQRMENMAEKNSYILHSTRLDFGIKFFSVLPIALSVTKVACKGSRERRW